MNRSNNKKIVYLIYFKNKLDKNVLMNIIFIFDKFKSIETMVIKSLIKKEVASSAQSLQLEPSNGRVSPCGSDSAHRLAR